jgi:hypothetical protein
MSQWLSPFKACQGLMLALEVVVQYYPLVKPRIRIVRIEFEDSVKTGKRFLGPP